jgi:hypothetical protein
MANIEKRRCGDVGNSCRKMTFSLMNTQTHILLACVALLPTAKLAMSVHSDSGEIAKKTVGVQPNTTTAMTFAAILGALAPDASLFVMWGVAKAQGVADALIWNEWYYSDFWQQLSAISNSIPVYLAIACLVAWLAGKQDKRVSALPLDIDDRARMQSRMQSSMKSWVRLPWQAPLLIFCAAALLHVITDLPLHHNDGHPHFWPFSEWIFSSPVSYWDPAHHGRVWSVIEIVLAVVMIAVLWKRWPSKLVRALLLLAGLAYALVAFYWMGSLG